MPETDDLGGGGLAAASGNQVVDQFVFARLDGRRSAAELGQKRGWHSSHVPGQEVGVRPWTAVPAPAQPLSEKVGEYALVHLAEGDDRLEELA